MRKRRLASIALFGLAAFAPPVAAPPSAAPLAAELRAAGAVVRAHDEDFWDDRQIDVELDRWWHAIRRWSAAEIEMGGPAATATLAERARTVDPQLALRILRLPGRAYLVAAENSAFGTVFILGPRRGHVATLWNLADVKRNEQRFPQLDEWSGGAVGPLCRGERLCGPFTIDNLRLLPPESHGRPRFLILATRTGMGSTVGAQLSLWRWTGHTAQPLVVRNFPYMLEQGQVLRVGRAAVHLSGKGEFRHFNDCGGCYGRQVEWIYRLTPSEVRPMRLVSHVPEVDLVDSLFERLARGRRTDDLATPGAVARLRRIVADQGGGPGERFNFGMLNGWRVSGRGRDRRLCLAADDLRETVFRIAGTGEHMRIVGVWTVKDDDCGKGAHS